MISNFESGRFELTSSSHSSEKASSELFAAIFREMGLLKEFLDGIAALLDLAHGVAEPAFAKEIEAWPACFIIRT